MDVSTEELTALLDREQIRNCIARLARGEDRRDTGLIGGSFWPEAAIDLGMFAGSFDEYLAWVVLYDWYQDLGRSIDWSQGLMGLPFSADHYTGRSVGDHSGTFFGQGAKWAR
jgi:hypothetical protein